MPATLIGVLAERGITTPTPIQAVTLPDALAGRDVLGRGRTGSGKTYAFLLPMLTRLATGHSRRSAGRPRALILAPTRELATQIDEAMTPLAAVLGLRSCTVFGGVGQNPQVTALRAGVDVVVACPGRLEDLIGQRHLTLDGVEVTVLDEADHMADLGFLPGVKRILDRTPRGSQRMLFSATLDAGVDAIVARYLVRPVTHQADSAQSPVSTMSHHVLHVSAADHLPVLVDLAAAPGRTVVFTRTKHRAKKLARQLNAAGVAAVELHGNLSQGARTRTMDAFSSGRAATLVATDIAARGIHVDDVALVVHADPPVEHKSYLHRSGRTARAGAEGTVITLMTDEQVREVRDLTRRAGVTATTTRADARHPILRELAPGERTFGSGVVSVVTAPTSPAGRRAPAGAGSGQPRRRRPGGATRPDPTGRRGQQTAAQGTSGSAERQQPARQQPAGKPPTRQPARQEAGRQAAGRQAAGRQARHGAAAFSAGVRSR